MRMLFAINLAAECANNCSWSAFLLGRNSKENENKTASTKDAQKEVEAEAEVVQVCPLSYGYGFWGQAWENFSRPCSLITLPKLGFSLSGRDNAMDPAI